MAKTAKVKKREVSVHSRAARREEPGVDGSSATRKAADTGSDYKPWLHNAQNAGVSKKKSKHLSRQQRVRQQRGLEKAEINLDKLDKKVADSKSRGKKVNARRVDWDELNDKLPGKDHKPKTNEVVSTASTDNAVKPMEDIYAPDLQQTISSQPADQSAAQVSAVQDELDEIT